MRQFLLAGKVAYANATDDLTQSLREPLVFFIMLMVN